MAGQIADSRTLQLQIAASTELLIRNLKTADQAVGEFRRAADANLQQIDGRFERLGKPLANFKAKIVGLSGGGIAAVAGAALGGAGLIDLAKRGLEYASSLQEVSQQLGVTAKGLQELRFAATQVGVSQADLERGLQRLTRTMGDAEAGAKEPTRAFAALGLSIADLKGRTADEVLVTLAERLSKISDPAQRAAVEVALFGKAGQQLDPLLTQGAAGLKAFADEAARLGFVLSAKQIADADQAADKFAELKKVLEANIAKAVADNAEAIFTFADALEKAAVKAVEFVTKVRGAYRILSTEGLKADITATDDEVAAAGTATGWMDRKRRQYREARATYHANPTRENLTAYMNAVGGFSGAVGAARDEKAASALARAQIFVNGGRTTGAFKAPAGPKGKTAEQLADEAARNRKSYLTDEAAAAQHLASVRADLAGTADARLQVELQSIEAAKAARDAEIAETAKLNPVVAAHADHLRQLNAQTAEGEKQVAIIKRDTTVARDNLSLRLSGLDNQRDLIEAQSQLATTAKARRDAERRLLNLQHQEEKAQLELRSNDLTISPQERQAASDRLKALPDIYGARQAASDRQNAGPLDQYRYQLHAATDDMQEALERVKVDGLQSLEDGFVGIITGTESVSSAFKKMAASIIADLARIAIEKAIVSAIGGAFFGLKDGGEIPAFADGGLNGLLRGPGGDRSDSIVARLSNGEFVVNAASTRKHLGLLRAINNGAPGFADGGQVTLPRVPTLGAGDIAMGGKAGSSIVVHVDARGAQNPEQVRQIARQAVFEAAPIIVAASKGQVVSHLRTPTLPRSGG